MPRCRRGSLARRSPAHRLPSSTPPEDRCRRRHRGSTWCFAAIRSPSSARPAHGDATARARVPAGSPVASRSPPRSRRAHRQERRALRGRQGLPGATPPGGHPGGRHLERRRWKTIGQFDTSETRPPPSELHYAATAGAAAEHPVQRGLQARGRTGELHYIGCTTTCDAAALHRVRSMHFPHAAGPARSRGWPGRPDRTQGARRRRTIGLTKPSGAADVGQVPP